MYKFQIEFTNEELTQFQTLIDYVAVVGEHSAFFSGEHDQKKIRMLKAKIRNAKAIYLKQQQKQGERQ